MPGDIPKFAAIREALLRAIQEGEYTEQLPGERVIAKEYGVAHMTARRAVDALVAEGILYREPDRGTFVRRPGKGGARLGRVGYVLLKERGARATAARTPGGRIESPYYATLFEQLASACRRRNLTLMFHGGLEDVYPFAAQRAADGLVVSYFPWMRAVIAKVATHTPVVLLDNGEPNLAVPAVLIDNAGGSRLAVEHLLRLGHRRIGFVSGPARLPVATEKLRGYRDALRAAGLRPSTELVFAGDFHSASGQAAATHFLSLAERPTAVTCANDAMAIGLMKGLLERGVRIPGEMSVVGFDDVELAATVYPALTTIRADYPRLGETALDLLARCIDGEALRPEPVRIATSLVERDSTAPPRER
jgi:DNA-binding LacI/PurR family transcriptional regulator